MGKVLMVLGIVVLVFIALIVGCTLLVHDAGEDAQEDFFNAVLSGDPAQVMAQMDPEFENEIDKPVLGAWMAAVKEHLGAFKGLSASGWSINISETAAGSKVESSGTVNFEKGEATSKLLTVDGKIRAFKVRSSDLPDNWFTELEDVSLYDERARAFLGKLLEGDLEAAIALTHENLAQKMDAETMKAGMGRLATHLGPIAKLDLLEDIFTSDDGHELLLRYTIDGETNDVTANVRFQFIGMKGHILGFNVPE